jgi:hypothetical protein
MTKSLIRTVAGANEILEFSPQISRKASSARVAGLLFTVTSALCCGGAGVEAVTATHWTASRN